MGTKIPPETLRSLYITMLRIRIFEEKVAELLAPQPEIRCPVHLYTGQEAVATGVCANLRKSDYVFSTHRSHGHYIAKGGDMKTLMAELYGRLAGCSHGKGGSMHVASPELGLPGSSAIVGGTIPVAVGAALAFSLKNDDGVSVAFFGDGAVQEGVFYESLNFASLKRLPVIFVCENNLYSTHMPIASSLANTKISKIADAFDTVGVRVDGNNVLEICEIAGDLISRARHGEGPSLIECLTYRWHGHVGPSFDLDKGLRSKEELDYWTDRCPIKAVEDLPLSIGMSEEERLRSRMSVEKEVEEAIAFARESSYPADGELLNVFKTPH